MAEVPGRSRSVSATRSIFGESIVARKQEKNRAADVLGQENLSPEMKKLAHADMDRLKERKADVDNERAGAEAELSRTRTMAKDLERQIEETKARAASKRSELNAMWASRAENKKGTEDVSSRPEEEEYADVVQELDRARQELRRLRVEVKSASEAKAKAESDIVTSALKIQTGLRAADEMKRLVEEANEEHVLVELARIEAERELREIDAQRRAEAERFARDMEETNAKIEELRKDVGRVRDMEAKLAITNSDVEVLQAEMELVRAMETKKLDGAKKREEEEEALLRAAETELDAAKKELESVKAGGFQFMTSMDSTRTEIMLVTEEVNRLKAREKESDAQVQQLNAKLLKARAKMESVTASSERSSAIVSNLTSALRQLRAETDAAEKEAELTEMEQRCVRAETETVNAEMAVTEARVGKTVRKLEAAKAAEAAAMRKLKATVVSTMQARASAASLGKVTITVSRFEYEYLTGRAALVHVVGEKKVAAAQAWARALEAGERELAARAATAERAAREAGAAEARTAAEAERAEEERRAAEQELYDLNAAAEQEGLLCAYPPRRRVSTTTRRSSVSSVNGAPNGRPPSFAIKRKRKVVPSLLKLVKERRANGRQLKTAGAPFAD